MVEAIESCSTDKSVFWRHLKSCRSTGGSKILAIKNKKDQVIYEVNDILKVWSNHFAALGTPKDDPKYDQRNFDRVNEEVQQYNLRDDESIFTEKSISTNEVQKAINKLKMNKSCGYDGISAEHVKYGGALLVVTLTIMFNLILRFEYIPRNFGRGIQIPIF